jgi:hypothetical protein
LKTKEDLANYKKDREERFKNAENSEESEQKEVNWEPPSNWSYSFYGPLYTDGDDTEF